MKITNTKHNDDNSMTITIQGDGPPDSVVRDALTARPKLTSLRMSLVRVAQQAGVSLAPVGFTLDRPAFEDLMRNARTNEEGWNRLCGNTIGRIEEMQHEITTLKQQNRGLHADLNGMVAQAEEREREQINNTCRLVFEGTLPAFMRMPGAGKTATVRLNISQQEPADITGVPTHEDKVVSYFGIGFDEWINLSEGLRDKLMTTYDFIHDGRA